MSLKKLLWRGLKCSFIFYKALNKVKRARILVNVILMRIVKRTMMMMKMLMWSARRCGSVTGECLEDADCAVSNIYRVGENMKCFCLLQGGQCKGNFCLFKKREETSFRRKRRTIVRN